MKITVTLNDHPIADSYWVQRGALLAGSFTRFWRFTIEQPSRFVLSLAGFRACLLAGRR